MEKYFVEETEKTVQSINKLKNEKTFAFTLLSDVHIHPEKKDNIERFERTLKNIKAVHEQCNIDAIFYLGDIAYVTSIYPASYWTQDVTDKQLRYLKKSLYECNKNSYFVAGNHDGANARPAYPEKWYELMLDPDKVKAEKNQGYFFVDFDKYKVRAICLMDTQANENIDFYGYTKEQLSWLCESALDVPDDYNILLFAHIALHGQRMMESQKNSSDLVGVLNAFQDKGKYESDVVSCDFTHKKGGKICALFAGHEHIQWSGYKSGLPCRQILTPSNLTHTPQHEPGWSLPEGFVGVDRKLFDVTEDLWDTVIFDAENNSLHVIRFGAGDDITYSL